MPYFPEKVPHKQCQECHKIFDSPFEGQNPGHDVNIITEEGEMINSAAPEDVERQNVSHTYCEDCYPTVIQRMREESAALKRAREKAGNSGANG